MKNFQDEEILRGILLKLNFRNFKYHLKCKNLIPSYVPNYFIKNHTLHIREALVDNL